MPSCCFCSCCSCSRVGHGLRYENVEFSSLTNHDGLTNSQVGAILKDTRGYIWFGTQSGLCRFDGFRMKTFLL